MDTTKQVVCNGCLSRVPRGLPQCPYCGYSFANTNPAGTLPVNTVLANRYTLGKCVALDGEGVSYAAVDAQTQRRVVIKEYVPVTICASRTREGAVLPRREREVLFKTTRMDFLDLYRSLVALGPVDGLLRVYDLFEENNTAYAVREPETGTSLLSYLQARHAPLTQAEAITLLRPVVYGVEAMHQKGLLHRGISPETIFIGADGRAKLSGFATLGLRTADSELRSQLYEGYAAPEQYAVAEFDGKYTDVYGLAAVFYRVLTGRTPPPANRRRTSDTLIPPRNLETTIPTFVSAALMRGLRMVAAERLQTVGDLLTALTQPVREERAARESHNKTLWIGLAVGALAIGLIVLILVLTLRGGGAAASSSSSVSASSVSQSVSVAPATVQVPSFLGQQYTVVQQNTEYIQNFMFALEYEFSSEYAQGEIMDQSPSPGKEVEIGAVITLTVSRGPETLLMPDVIGKARTDAKAQLDGMGIKYMILELENDGTYAADTVAKCDTASGTPIDPNKDQVVLYVAKEPVTTPAAPASTPTPAA